MAPCARSSAMSFRTVTTFVRADGTGDTTVCESVDGVPSALVPKPAPAPIPVPGGGPVDERMFLAGRGVHRAELVDALVGKGVLVAGLVKGRTAPHLRFDGCAHILLWHFSVCAGLTAIAIY